MLTVTLGSMVMAQSFKVVSAESRPAQVNERGVVSLPRPPFDPVPLATAGLLLMAGIALGSGFWKSGWETDAAHGRTIGSTPRPLIGRRRRVGSRTPTPLRARFLQQPMACAGGRSSGEAGEGAG